MRAPEEAREPIARPPEAPWRFSIADLLRWTALCSAVLALFTWLGPWGLLVGSLLIVGYIVFRKDLQLFIDGLFFIAGAVLLLSLLLPDVGSRPPSARSICSNNLKQIALALTMYETTHGTLPPAYFADDQGRPTHSWRAMILKELGRPDLAEAYRWDEPWDGPNNRRLHGVGIDILRCPSDAGTPPQGTSYVAVVGPGTAFPGETSVSLAQIADGAADTLLVVEVHNSGIGWFEPRDLHFTQMARTINPQHGQGLSSEHRSGVNVAFADGSTRFLLDDLPPDQLQAMLTIDGGEAVKLP